MQSVHLLAATQDIVKTWSRLRLGHRIHLLRILSTYVHRRCRPSYRRVLLDVELLRAVESTFGHVVTTGSQMLQ